MARERKLRLLPSLVSPSAVLPSFLVSSLLFGSAVDCRRRPAVAHDVGPSSPDALVHGRTIPCAAEAGATECTEYDSAQDALRDLLASRPLVLAIGEAHAPAGARVPSAARRFADDLLPLLAGRASDLLLEAMMPPRGCPVAAAEVRAQEEAVTARQAPQDQSESLSLRQRARSFGIVPDLLRPSCDDLEAMRREGEEGIDVTLQTIARLTLTQSLRLVERDARSDADRGKMVVIYGGLLHNDLAPAPERARWSYAPQLAAAVGDRFVSLDLIVPEWIRDDAAWRALPWLAAYDPLRMAERPVLLRVGPRSFVLIFARA